MDEEQAKRVRKAKATRSRNLKKAEEERRKTESVKRSLAKVRAENKALKDMIKAGWRPPN